MRSGFSNPTTIITHLRMPSLLFLVLTRIINSLSTSRHKFLYCTWVVEWGSDTTKNFEVVFIDNYVAILCDKFRVVHKLEKDFHFIFGGNLNLFQDVLGTIQIIKKLVWIIYCRSYFKGHICLRIHSLCFALSFVMRSVWGQSWEASWRISIGRWAEWWR